VIIQKSYRYRLEPDGNTRQLFARFAGSSRYLYNWALAARKSAYEESKKTLSYAEQCKLATQLKKEEETAWLAEIHSQVLQQSLKDLDTAYQNTFRRVKKGQTPGFPRFKKKGQKDSFRYPQGVQVAEGKVFLPKIGWVPYCNSGYKGVQPTTENLLQATVKREGKHWFVSFACEIEHQSAVPFTGSAVGIDVGLKTFATLSEGTVIENPRFLKKQLRKLKIEQRRLKNKQRGSANRKKQAARIARLHTKVKNARKDFAHKASTTIVKNHDVVVIEDLNIKGMVKNHKLARAISDVGWGQFLAMLEYKLKWAGKSIISINRFFASSQICSCCGAKKPMPLNLRTYDCAHCGLSLDRDLNAALNIRRQGMSQQLVEVLSSGGTSEARIPAL
jgi:putative transposase